MSRIIRAASNRVWSSAMQFAPVCMMSRAVVIRASWW